MKSHQIGFEGKVEGFPKIKVDPSSFSVVGGEREGLLTQTSLDSSVFTRRKMSQAEKQRGWVKMKQTAVSAVKISIQGPAGLDKVYLSTLLLID